MKKLVVLGAGESGVGAAILGLKQGYEVFVSDKGKIKEKYKNVLENLELNWEEDTHSDAKIMLADVVVKSPGIPDKVELIKELKKKGIPVVSEIEFASWYCDAKIIAITGSNGKTTTTLLTHHILKNAGVNVGLAGNIGESFAKQVAETKKDWYVLELSSFQLDGIEKFKPNIAMLLNISPDHLDRYEYKMSNYVDSKFRIIKNQTEEDFFIYWKEDEIIKEELLKRNIKSKKLPYSLEEKIEGEGAYIESGKLIINVKDQFSMSIHDLALKGKHNTGNSMAAGIASRVLEIRKEIIRESLSDFQNVEHRLEFVARVHGIEFINDSKATNVNSTWYALESMEKRIVWIVGGVDKGNDYTILDELVTDKVDSIICLGKDNSKIIEAFKDKVTEIVEVGSAREAVQLAYRMGKKDMTVLLSPACASFDLFENYEDRGQRFKEAVRAL